MSMPHPEHDHVLPMGDQPTVFGRIEALHPLTGKPAGHLLPGINGHWQAYDSLGQSCLAAGDSRRHSLASAMDAAITASLELEGYVASFTQHMHGAFYVPAADLGNMLWLLVPRGFKGPEKTKNPGLLTQLLLAFRYESHHRVVWSQLCPITFAADMDAPWIVQYKKNSPIQHCPLLEDALLNLLLEYHGNDSSGHRKVELRQTAKKAADATLPLLARLPESHPLHQALR